MVGFQLRDNATLGGQLQKEHCSTAKTHTVMQAMF
jgi:hypothetical protein